MGYQVSLQHVATVGGGFRYKQLEGKAPELPTVGTGFVMVTENGWGSDGSTFLRTSTVQAVRRVEHPPKGVEIYHFETRQSTYRLVVRAVLETTYS